ncbi:MAG TPA: NADH-quinone oxidoreductase subunit NuoH [Microthrixaceae bacterium]|nr:NADH-quinone oxidoreductase subunit NuoH [Microthrixaceae bacterium]
MLAAVMNDPLLEGGIGFEDVLIVLLKVLVGFGGLLVAVILMVWFERKVIADMQNRLGPNRAGPFGILQTLADGMKLLLKEDLIPDRADRFVFRIAPFLSLIPAFVSFSIVPIMGNFSGGRDGRVEILGRETYMQVADPQIGILLFLAMSSIAVYGVMLAGWASGSKYPLLGSVRATAQMISYEAALGLSLASVLLFSGSLSTNAIVAEQSGFQWNLWMTGLVPFVIFTIAGTAELNRPPFDLVEAEQELVGGFQTEYSSFRFAMFYLAEFLNTVTMSAIIVTLFFGGPSGPDFGITGWVSDYVLPFVWFFLKVFVFLVMFVLFRGTLPRLRYDQLMDLGWKVLIPLALGWFLLLVGVRISADQDWNVIAVVAVAVAALAAGGGLLLGAIRSSAAKRAELSGGASYSSGEAG